MKILPEHIDEIDAFYKAKSEEEFAIDLPNDIWQAIESQLPSSPVATSKPEAIAQPASKSINFFHGGIFFLAGVLCTVLAYSVYLRVTYQENNASIKLQVPDIDTPASTLPLKIGAQSKTDGTQHLAPPDHEEVAKKKPTISTPKQSQTTNPSGHSESAADKNNHSQTTQATAIKAPSNGVLPSVSVDEKAIQKVDVMEEKIIPTTIEKVESQDFYQKYSKQAHDSLSQKLFIPKK